jgi:hypothetical protein
VFGAQTVFFSDSWTPRSNPSRPDLLYPTAGGPTYYTQELASQNPNAPPAMYTQWQEGQTPPMLKLLYTQRLDTQNPSRLDLLYQTAGLLKSLVTRRAVNLTAGPSESFQAQPAPPVSWTPRIPRGTTCYTRQQDSQSVFRPNLLCPTAGPQKLLNARPAIPIS